MTVPKQVQRQQVEDVLRDLHLDPHNVRRLVMEPGMIMVEVYVREPDGRIKVDGHRAVTIVEKIEILI